MSYSHYIRLLGSPNVRDRYSCGYRICLNFATRKFSRKQKPHVHSSPIVIKNNSSDVIDVCSKVAAAGENSINAKSEDNKLIRGRDTKCRIMPGQRLYPATKEDIEILGQSRQKYPSPIDIEGGIIIRLIRLSDTVTSPVGRVVHNSQYGIRNNERYHIIIMGSVVTLCLVSLGFWQLRRLKWKGNLIEFRKKQLKKPKFIVNAEIIPWVEDSNGTAVLSREWEYRTVEVTGIMDHPYQVFVGPRPGLSQGMTGYSIVCPLRLDNGATVLVNRGHISIDDLIQLNNKSPISQDSLKSILATHEHPERVTVIGVLVGPEIVNSISAAVKPIRNRPMDNVFLRADPYEISKIVGTANMQITQAAIINAISTYPKCDKTDEERNSEVVLPFDRKQKKDYLLFYADEHTHFNYAIQWFLLSAITATMTIYKFVQVTRWKW